jgi:type IV secretory pathway VirB9-like protein
MRSLTAILLASVSVPALAAQPPGVDPTRDTHIREVAYSPIKRTEIVGVIGQPTTITFPKGESVYRVIQSEAPDESGVVQAPWRSPGETEVKDNPLGNNLPLWPGRPGVSMMTVITQADDTHAQKTYAFRLLARPAEAGAEDAPGVVLNLIFTGIPPAQQAAAAQAWWAKKRAEADQQAKDHLRSDTLTASAGTCHYSAKGKKTTAIEPRCPMDDGQWTFLRFPGLSRKPAVYIVASGNTERLARQHGDGDFVVVEEIAPLLRLRLGEDVLDIINNRYDPVGAPANTGTISPGVVREVIEAPAK